MVFDSSLLYTEIVFLSGATLHSCKDNQFSLGYKIHVQVSACVRGGLMQRRLVSPAQEPVIGTSVNSKLRIL